MYLFGDVHPIAMTTRLAQRYEGEYQTLNDSECNQVPETHFARAFVFIVTTTWEKGPFQVHHSIDKNIILAFENSLCTCTFNHVHRPFSVAKL